MAEVVLNPHVKSVDGLRYRIKVAIVKERVFRERAYSPTAYDNKIVCYTQKHSRIAFNGVTRSTRKSYTERRISIERSQSFCVCKDQYCGSAPQYDTGQSSWSCSS